MNELKGMFKMSLDLGRKHKLDGRSCEISITKFPVPSKGDFVEFSKDECLSLFGIECDEDFLYTEVSMRTYSFNKRLSFEIVCSIDN